MLCAEQTAVPPNEAENLLASLHEEEKLSFQRLLESTWADHRATLAPTLTEDETVVHARWLIEHYYVDLNKYVLESQRRRSIADMLQPFVGGSDADAASASHICQIMANLQAMHVGRFATHLEEAFGKMVTNLPEYLQANVEIMKKNWFDAQGGEVFQEFVDSVEQRSCMDVVRDAMNWSEISDTRQKNIEQ